MSPRGVVPREDSEPFHDAFALGLPHPPQHAPDREREQRAAVPVGRGSAASALVTARSALAPEVVPGRGLVAAQRSQPVGEAHEHHAPGPRDTQYLAQHEPRIRHVFEHVGGEADVYYAVEYR